MLISDRGSRAATLGVAIGVIALGLSARGVQGQSYGTYYVHLGLSVEPGQQWAVNSIWFVPWGHHVGEPSPENADARLVFSDKFGTVTHSQLVSRLESCRGGQCREVPILHIYTPAQPDAVLAELYAVGPDGSPTDLRASLSRSGHAPRVELLRPLPGEPLLDGMMIEWRGSDDDGDELTYLVMVKAKVAGVESRFPLALRHRATQLRFVRDGLPADPNASITVEANDGFNTSWMANHVILEGDVPPDIRVTSPANGAAFGYGANILLSATAYDAEDGWVAIRWSSDLDGPIPGESRNLINWPSATRGRHRVTATAPDSGGNEATDSITVFVGVEPSSFKQAYLPAVSRGSGSGLRVPVRRSYAVDVRAATTTPPGIATRLQRAGHTPGK